MDVGVHQPGQDSAGTAVQEFISRDFTGEFVCDRGDPAPADFKEGVALNLAARAVDEPAGLDQ